MTRDGGHGGGNGAFRGRRFVLLCVTTFGAFANYSLLLSVVPLWAVAGGAGDAGAGGATAVLMLTTVLTQLGVPWLLTRVTHRAALGASAVLLGGPALLYPASADLAAVLAVSAVRGVGFGLVTVVGGALLARLVPPALHGRAVGLYGIAVGAPNLFALAGGVWLAQQVGYGTVFVLGGALPLVALAAVVAMGPEPRRPRPGASGVRGAVAPATPDDPASHRGHGSLRRLLLMLVAPWTVMTGAALATGGVYSFLPLALAHAGAAAAPAALFAFSAAVLLGRWLAGVMADRQRRGRLLAPGVVVAAAGLCGTAVAASVASVPVAVAAAVTGAFLYGLGFGAVQNETMVGMFARAGASGYGTASAAWNIAYDAGTGAGAISLGLVVEARGYAAAFAAAAVLVAACLPVALRMYAGPPGGRGGGRTSHVP